MRYTYDVGGSRLNARPLPGRCAALRWLTPWSHHTFCHIHTADTGHTLCNDYTLGVLYGCFRDAGAPILDGGRVPGGQA